MGRTARARSRVGYALSGTVGRLPGLSDRQRNILDFHALRLASSTPQAEAIIARGLRRIHGPDTDVSIDTDIDLDSVREMGIALLVVARHYPEVGIEAFRIDDWANSHFSVIPQGLGRTYFNERYNRLTDKAVLWFDADTFSANNRPQALEDFRTWGEGGDYPVQAILGPAFYVLHEFCHGMAETADLRLTALPDRQGEAHRSSLASRIFASLPVDERPAAIADALARYNDEVAAHKRIYSNPQRLEKAIAKEYQDHFGASERNAVSADISRVKLGANAGDRVPEESADGGATHLLDVQGLNPTGTAVGGWLLEGLGRHPNDRPPQLAPLLARMINLADARTGDTRVRDAMRPPPAPVNPWMSLQTPDPSLQRVIPSPGHQQPSGRPTFAAPDAFGESPALELPTIELPPVARRGDDVFTAARTDQVGAALAGLDPTTRSPAAPRNSTSKSEGLQHGVVRAIGKALGKHRDPR